MNRRDYSFAVGIVLLVGSFAFFSLPVVINLDAFFPVLIAIVSFVLAIGFFFMGSAEKSR